MSRVKAMVFAFLLLTLFPTASLANQHSGRSIEAEAKVAELFPETTGAISLHEKTSARLPNLRLKLTNYDVLLDGKKTGEVTRIVSLMREGLAAHLDVLVRYDSQGGIQGIVPLKPWKEEESLDDLAYFLWSLQGRDLRAHRATLASFIAGLSAGAALTDGLAPPAPDGGYSLSVKQLLLEPGAQLPSLKIQDLAGRTFDASAHKNSKLIISFLSPDNTRSGDMAQTIERTAAPAIRDRKVAVIHIITATTETAAEYGQTHALNETVAADPAGLLARMFQVPYTPYLFMFDKGTLTAPVRWEGEQKLQHTFSRFLSDGASTGKGAAK